MMDTTLLKRKNSFFRPLFLNSNKEISKFIFYSNGKINFKTNSGWLEHKRQDVQEMEIETPVKAIKENLNRKDNYYIKDNSESLRWKQNPCYNLYIYLKVKEHSETINYTGTQSIDFEKVYSIPITGYIPDYSKENRPLIKIDQVEMTVHSRFEQTKLGNKIQKLSKDFEKVIGSHVSIYDLEKLLENYNITKKRKVKE